MEKELKIDNENVVKSLLNKLANAELKASQFESVVSDLISEKEELLKTIEELKSENK